MIASEGPLPSAAAARCLDGAEASLAAITDNPDHAEELFTQAANFAYDAYRILYARIRTMDVGRRLDAAHDRIREAVESHRKDPTLGRRRMGFGIKQLRDLCADMVACEAGATPAGGGR